MERSDRALADGFFVPIGSRAGPMLWDGPALTVMHCLMSEVMAAHDSQSARRMGYPRFVGEIRLETWRQLRTIALDGRSLYLVFLGRVGRNPRILFTWPQDMPILVSRLPIPGRIGR